MATTNKYSKGKIYKLINDVDDKEYVGSTIQTLAQRKGSHKKDAVKKPHTRAYQHLNKIGWDNVKIILVENYPCDNKEELTAREAYWIRELKAELNKVIPSRTKKEYYQEHKEDILAKEKAKYQENKETILEKSKVYRENNKEKVAESNKKWRENNKEALKISKDIYRKANMDKINARNRANRALKKQAS